MILLPFQIDEFCKEVYVRHLKFQTNDVYVIWDLSLECDSSAPSPSLSVSPAMSNVEPDIEHDMLTSETLSKMSLTYIV